MQKLIRFIKRMNDENIPVKHQKNLLKIYITGKFS